MYNSLLEPMTMSLATGTWVFATNTYVCMHKPKHRLFSLSLYHSRMPWAFEANTCLCPCTEHILSIVFPLSLKPLHGSLPPTLAFVHAPNTSKASHQHSPLSMHPTNIKHKLLSLSRSSQRLGSALPTLGFALTNYDHAPNLSEV